MLTLTSSLQRRHWARSDHQRCLETDWSCSSSRAWTSNSDPWKRMTMRLTWTWLVPIPSNWKVGQRCSRTWSPPSTSSPSGSQSSRQQLLRLQSLYENYNISPWVWWILGNTCKKCITMRKMRVFYYLGYLGNEKSYPRYACGSHGLSDQRTKSSSAKDRQLEVGGRNAPRLLVFKNILPGVSIIVTGFPASPFQLIYQWIRFEHFGWLQTCPPEHRCLWWRGRPQPQRQSIWCQSSPRPWSCEPDQAAHFQGSTCQRLKKEFCLTSQC